MNIKKKKTKIQYCSSNGKKAIIQICVRARADQMGRRAAAAPPLKYMCVCVTDANGRKDRDREKCANISLALARYIIAPL